jgi:hypothetical protein
LGTAGAQDGVRRSKAPNEPMVWLERRAAGFAGPINNLVSTATHFEPDRQHNRHLRAVVAVSRNLFAGQ